MLCIKASGSSGSYGSGSSSNGGNDDERGIMRCEERVAANTHNIANPDIGHLLYDL